MVISAIPLLVLVTIVSLTAAGTKTPKKCTFGEYVSGNTCQKCPPGTYQDKPQTKAKRCIKCPYNTYTPFHGVVSHLLCLPCPRDRTSPEGAARCRKCSKGSVGICDSSATGCIFCPPGTTVTPVTYQCICKSCKENSVTTKANEEYCTECPPGFRPNSDHSECVPANCEDGLDWDGFACTPCTYNKFRRGNMPWCEECPWGTYTNNMEGPNPKCFKCKPGEYVTDMLPQTSTPENFPHCEKCPKNSKTAGFSKHFCRKRGKPCPDNTVEDAEGDCIVCDYNHRVDTKKKKCVPCEEKSTSPRGIRTKCIPCGPGEVPSSFGECECREGYARKGGVCTICPAGEHTRYAECERCEEGYVSEEGSSECTACPEGSSTFEGRNKCEPIPDCPTGYIEGRGLWYTQFGENEPCISGTTGCPSIAHQVTKIGDKLFCVDEKGKVVCPQRQVFNGKDECIECWEGGMLLMQKGKLVCKSCPIGSTSFSSKARKCTPCGEGFLKSRNYRGQCVCNWGRFVNDDQDCVRCTKGYANDIVGLNTCFKCENGFTPSKHHRSCACASPKEVNSEGKCV